MGCTGKRNASEGKTRDDNLLESEKWVNWWLSNQIQCTNDRQADWMFFCCIVIKILILNKFYW